MIKNPSNRRYALEWLCVLTIQFVSLIELTLLYYLKHQKMGCDF